MIDFYNCQIITNIFVLCNLRLFNLYNLLAKITHSIAAKTEEGEILFFYILIVIIVVVYFSIYIVIYYY